MSRRGLVFFAGVEAGVIEEFDDGYRFTYAQSYCLLSGARGISVTMPVREEAYVSPVMLPFFDGLIPEGWLLSVAAKNWKIDPRDRMGLLLSCCNDCIGAVTVKAVSDE